jgi:hypothetical protein
MIDRDQPPSREDEIRRAVFGQVDLQTAELEIVSSIYDGFAAAILVKGQPRTIALTREYGDAVQLMAMIERSRSAQSAASEAGAAAGDPKGRRSIYDAAYDSIRKGAPGLSDATCAAIARSINLKVANGSASERGAVESSWSESFIADEDDGPVSGIVIDLPDGSQIWTGECSSALLDSMGDERPDGSCLFLTVAIKGKPTRVVASIASTQDGIALARALAAAHVTRSAEPGAIDEDWIRGLIGEAVVMAEDQEREDESDEEICRIAESVLNAILPYLRAQPQAREGAQPVAWRSIGGAPKDGTTIDVWRVEGGRETVFWGYPHHECGEMGSLCDSDWHSLKEPGWVCATFNEFIGGKHNPFTHWKPVDGGPSADSAHPAPDALRAAVSDIAAERQRQVDAEGWSADRDDGYADAELAKSAAAYTLSACGFSPDAAREMWPRSWSAHWWKPTTARRDLVKAGALIVAEIERLDRQALAALQAEQKGGA